MVLDTSALIAIIRDEFDREELVEILADAVDPVISAATVAETRIVAEAKLGPSGPDDVNRLLKAGGVRVIALDPVQADLAHAAWSRYGKGRHAAGLNLGDCFSYALAKSLDRPLLFKGNDLSHTDVKRP